MKKLDLLKQQLQTHSKKFDDESTKHKNMYRNLRYATFIITAISTALASLALSLPKYQTGLTVAIIVMTATAGVIASAESLRKPSELWIHERTTYYALRDLQSELEFRCAEPHDSASEPKIAAEIFERMQAILGASGDKWNRTQNNKSGNEKPALEGTAKLDKGNGSPLETTRSVGG